MQNCKNSISCDFNQPKTMALNPTLEKENGYSMFLQREEFMISLSNDAIPTFRKAHFLKPLLNTAQNYTPPKPPLSFSSNPNIFHKLSKNVMFKCRKSPSVNWKTWVNNLQQTHNIIWKKIGIFDAIMASTFKINIDIELIMQLAQKWCPETNTFIFPWGECTITMEDIMILGGFSVLGNCASLNSEDKEMEAKLANCCTEIRRNSWCKLHINGWTEYFQGKGGELEHVALLVLWLSRYVFSKHSKDINTDVFPLAIRLAKGTRIALAPAVLASIYRDFTLLKGKIVALNGENGDDGSNLVVWSQLLLVQVWAWERFPTLSPKPFLLVHGEPRIARWHNVHKLKTKSLRIDVDYAEEFFLWRPYCLYLENWEFPMFCSDKEMWVVINSEVDEDYLSFARCLKAYELVGVDCVEQYLPHRVGMQFGIDQDIPESIEKTDLKLAWKSYDDPFEGLKCYVPPRLLQGDITVEYLKWWRGGSSLHNEALVSCQSQRNDPRKLNVPHRYSAQSSNVALQFDSWGWKKISEGKLAPCENMASQTHASFVDGTVSLGARNPDNEIDDESDRSHHLEGIRKDPMKSHLNEVINLLDHDTNMPDYAEMMEEFESVCEDKENTTKNTLRCSSTQCDHEEMMREFERGCKDMEKARKNTLNCSSTLCDHEEMMIEFERACKDMDNTRNSILHYSSTPCRLPTGINPVKSNEKTHKEKSPFNEERPSENRMNMIKCEQDTVMNPLNFSELEQVRTYPYEHVNQINKSFHDAATKLMIPENRTEDGNLLEHIGVEVNKVSTCNIIMDEKSKCCQSSDTHIPSVTAIKDAVIVNELLQRSETVKSSPVFAEMNQVVNSLNGDTNMPVIEGVVKVVERACEDLEDTSKKASQSSSTFPICIGFIGNTEKTHKEDSPFGEEQLFGKRLKMVEQVTMMNPLHDAATIADVEETSDQDPIEALCKEFEERISKLEVKVSKLMAG